MPRSLLTHTLCVAAAIGLLVSTAATASQRVLIIGGAGHAGSAVARMLIERGDHVTAFVRATTDRSKLEGVPVDYVVGDAMKADEVAAALEGKQFDVMFETVQVWPGTDASYTQMYENFVPWAKRMNVKQFISIGAERCLNKTFVIDDPTIKPQYDHWICKRANEGPVVSGNVPACGPMPRVTEAQLRGNP